MTEAPGEPNSETVIDVVHRGSEHWAYRLQPITGRKHQLRVPMAALGAPLLHDRSYPQLLDEAPDDPEKALQLLAHRLAFLDPLSGVERVFESPCTLRCG